MSTIHHVAITASSFEQSITFYKKLGFEVLFTKDTPEIGKRLALLGLGDLKLELFWWADNIDHPAHRETIGNNIKEIGQKHFAIRVDSITQTAEWLAKLNIAIASDPSEGDAGYKFLFIRDPDGIWIEYVQDNKYD
jgi:catechol 2,3-dioxygenase-like lactoylglutathione lyase family enzyme